MSVSDDNRIKLPVASPDYNILLNWWDAWPSVRPELLDFWARGNFTRRLFSRIPRKDRSLLVRVRYLDEIETALKRLALLGMEVDFAWGGAVSSPSLVMVPQHIDYEDSGGWGYMTASGDELVDSQGRREWCPALSIASLLPDTVTDWLAVEARGFLQSGQLMVCPIENIGLLESPGHLSEEHFKQIANATSFIKNASLAKVIFELDLPRLDGMSIMDTYKFCVEFKDSLTRFQTAIGKLLGDDHTTLDEPKLSNIIAEVKDSIAELRLSGSSLAARKRLTALGASIAMSGIALGVYYLGVQPGVAVMGGVASAIATLGLWHRNIEAEAGLRTKPYYAVWQLQGNIGPQPEWRPRPSQWKMLDCIKANTPPTSEKMLSPYHWLTSPTAGWAIPTGFVP